MFGSILYSIRTVSPSRTGPSMAEVRNVAEEATQRLEARLDYLELACAGLWELLKTKHGYTDDELVSSIQMVDARDGKVDGKMAQINRVCPYCHRKLLSRDSRKCSWCGGDLPGSFLR